jgi:type I restriction enzyme M protein
MVDIQALENWLWDAACVIRGPLDAPKFKDYILPLVFLKRLSDVFDDEIERLSSEYGDRDLALYFVEQERARKDKDKKVGIIRFYIPENARWNTIRQHGKVGLGQFLTDAVRAVARENESLQGVIDTVDFNAGTSGQRIIPDEQLSALIDVLSRHHLGLHDVEPDILGRAYEYLLRKFAEGQGQSAGEFYTPREVAVLMAHLLEPEPGMTVYDPTCGSGGLLIKCHLRLVERFTTERLTTERFTTENTESTEKNSVSSVASVVTTDSSSPSVSSVPSVVKHPHRLPPAFSLGFCISPGKGV